MHYICYYSFIAAMKKYFPLPFIFHFSFFVSHSQTDRILAATGRVIGMTSGGGNKGHGVVYGYNVGSGKDTTRFSFNNGTDDGMFPTGSLMQATDGMLYGLTYQGGTNNYGTLFVFNPVTHKDSVLVDFNGANGQYPLYSSLMQAGNGLLYGVTGTGGAFSQGVFFSYNIVTHSYNVIFSFNGTNGADPNGKLLQASDGMIYGMTAEGGLSIGGVLYRYNPITNKDTV